MAHIHRVPRESFGERDDVASVEELFTTFARSLAVDGCLAGLIELYRRFRRCVVILTKCSRETMPDDLSWLSCIKLV